MSTHFKVKVDIPPRDKQTGASVAISVRPAGGTAGVGRGVGIGILFIVWCCFNSSPHLPIRNVLILAGANVQGCAETIQQMTGATLAPSATGGSIFGGASQGTFASGMQSGGGAFPSQHQPQGGVFGRPPLPQDNAPVSLATAIGPPTNAGKPCGHGAVFFSEPTLRPNFLTPLPLPITVAVAPQKTLSRPTRMKARLM